MSPQSIALTIIGLVVLGTIVFALTSVRRLKMDPQEYIVGSRSFGALLLWILLAGEIYTSFTFLGAAGWAYGRGAATFYILAYGTVAYCIGFFLLPPLWKIGKERGLLTLGDLFIERYGSKALGVGVAVVQFFLVVPYVTLQLTGLQILLTIAGYGQYRAEVAVGAAFALMALFVFTAGLRGAAWASIVKDILVLGAVLFAGIALPIRFFGSPAAMIDHVLRAHPHWMTLPPPGPAPNSTYTVAWFVTTILLSGVGFFMGPANAPAIYSARSPETLRRNMIFMPLYQLILLFVFFAGFTALAVVPGLKGAAADQSFMLLMQRYYSAPVLGLVAAAGCLAALLPASTLLLGAASVFSKNVLGDLLNVATGDQARTLATRVLVLVIALLALLLWIYYKKSLVDLLLFYYVGVTQLAPGVIFAFTWRRVGPWPIAAGLVVGEYIGYYSLHNPIAPFGINPGFFALLVNVAVCVVLALAFPAKKKPAGVPAG